MAKNNAARVTKITESRQATRFDTSIDIPVEKRQKLIALMNARLADSIDLYSQTKFAHWNVKGKDFYQLHLLFDDIAEHVEEGVDTIAERITALGGRADGTIRQVASKSELEEYEIDARDGMHHVRTLAARVSSVANASREAIDKADELDDMATSDMFTEIVRRLDKDLYFLEAHLR